MTLFLISAGNDKPFQLFTILCCISDATAKPVRGLSCLNSGATTDKLHVTPALCSNRDSKISKLICYILFAIFVCVCLLLCSSVNLRKYTYLRVVIQQSDYDNTEKQKVAIFFFLVFFGSAAAPLDSRYCC